MLGLKVMKQRSATSVTSGLLTKLVLVGAAVVMSIATPLALMPKAYADQYDDKINALKSQISQFESRAGELRQQANTLQNELERISSEKAAIQTQIDLSQAEYEKLTANIKINEQKIADNKDALGITIADMYVDDTISPLEMLASSNNIGDYVDKQSYQAAVGDRLQQTITTIATLKKELEVQKADVERVLAEQKNQREGLIAKEAERQSVLDQTKGEEAAYNALVASTKSKMQAVHAEQQAALARITNGGVNNAGGVGAFQFRNFSGNQGCGGGYAYCGVMDSYADPWGLYNRECVSYSAWRATQMGKRVGHFSGRGNAYEWPSSASGWMGATVNNTPAVGAVAILPRTPGFAPIGHSMNVEAILDNGWVRISQFNFGGTGEYSTMDIKASGVVFVHFPS